ncbi:hypothetical protein Ssi02_50980 [Sinosporangium siamense]|uniref:Uncharacterized protein n=1 Tax=Sinosporangium siamense TaxID=1367973 RepID=A0A919RJB0_9ACTN|nr:hypothetical protein Ssi02_50980 [Sinosporangium siamense]
MLRALCALMPDYTFTEIARCLHMHRSTLSGHLSARRIPELALCLKLYDLAISAGQPNIPFSEEELRRAHSEAAITFPLCANCRMSQGEYDGQASFKQVGQLSRSSGNGHGGRLLIGEAEFVGGAARGKAPVPHKYGDRRRNVEAVMEVGGQVVQRLLSEDLARVRVLLHSVGSRCSPSEVMDAVDACRSGGLVDAADAILHYAGGRPAKEVLQVARVLVAAGRHADAALLLQAADPS